jgi:hypothetical protein
VTAPSDNRRKKANEATSARPAGRGSAETRWARIARKIELAATHLRTQGVLVRRRDAGRRAWVVRYRTYDPEGTRLRSIYIGGDDEPELVQRATRLLAELRGPSRRRREIDMFARGVRAARTLVKRLTGL